MATCWDSKEYYQKFKAHAISDQEKMIIEERDHNHQSVDSNEDISNHHANGNYLTVYRYILFLICLYLLLPQQIYYSRFGKFGKWSFAKSCEEVSVGAWWRWWRLWSRRGRGRGGESHRQPNHPKAPRTKRKGFQQNLYSYILCIIFKKITGFEITCWFSDKSHVSVCKDSRSRHNGGPSPFR